MYFKDLIRSRLNITPFNYFFALLKVFERWPVAPVGWCVNNIISLSAIHRGIPNIPISLIGNSPPLYFTIAAQDFLAVFFIKRDGPLNACNPNQVFVLNLSRFEQTRGPTVFYSTGLHQETSLFCVLQRFYSFSHFHHTFACKKRSYCNQRHVALLTRR